jgi:excisionase family DNA binding protein
VRPGAGVSARVESPLAAAVLEALDNAALVELAERLAPLLAERLGGQDEWKDTREAADYLRMGVSTLGRMAKAGEVPAHQDCPGGKYFFKRSELDAWRAAQ